MPLSRVRTLARWSLRAVAAVFTLAVLASAILYLATRGTYTVARTVAQDPTLPRVTVNGRLFHAEAHGPADAPVVLVLHGGPGNDYRYLLSLAALSDRYRVAFYDQRGTGLSPAGRLAGADARDDARGPRRDGRSLRRRPPGLTSSATPGARCSLRRYLGRHPEKLAGVVLAEPGLLTSAKAREFEALVRKNLSLRLLPYLALSWFRSLHVDGP